MTKAQYRRLCLVLIGPLLIAGFICSNIFYPYEKSRTVHCHLSSGGETCEEIGPVDSPYHKRFEGRAESWFGLLADGIEGPIRAHILASERLVNIDRVVMVMPTAFTPAGVVANVERVIGGKGTIFFTSKPGASTFKPGDLYLYCSGLIMSSDTPGTYGASCFQKDLALQLYFKPSAEAAVMLSEFESQYTAVAKGIEDNYRGYQIAAYPLFIYLFIILSLVVYGTRKAVNYVRLGSNSQTHPT